MDLNEFRPMPIPRMLILTVMLCHGMLFTACHAPADEPKDSKPDEARIALLVEQLGASGFAEREEANRLLLEIGADTLPALRAAERHTSVEVRERARRIRVEIDKAVFEQVTKRFILEPDSQQSFGLPGWNAFRKIAGDARTSKLLFVLMLRNQRDLAQYVEIADRSLGTASEGTSMQQLEARLLLETERLRARNFRGQPADVGDTVGMLFACSMFKNDVSIEVNETISMGLLLGTHTEYFNKVGYGRCMRALTGNWIPKTQSVLTDRVLMLAMQHAIREGAIVARRHLDSSSDLETRVQALQCLSRFGNETDIAAVAQLLDEEAVVYEFTDRNELAALRDGIRVEDMPPPGLKNALPAMERTKIVRLNDVALAVCLMLGSEDVAKVFPKFQANAPTGVDLMDVAFASDEQDQHKLAIASWRKEHPQFVAKSN